MSGLAHYLEDEGIATTLIALVRPHAERMTPPRALWVPFELGRPLGEPGDAAFQRRVLRAALALLERDDGPVVLADFDEDAPGAAGDPGWTPPDTGAAADLADEVSRLRPAYDRSVAARGRTAVGIVRLDPEALARLVGGWAHGEAPSSPRRDLGPVQALRFAVDDLKAYHLEAAAHGGRPSSAQLQDWLWGTRLADTLHRLRASCLASERKSLQGVVPFLVPADRVRDR